MCENAPLNLNMPINETEIQICERCIPQGISPTLIKYPNGRECKFCTFPFDSYRFSIQGHSYQTISCPRCAKKNLICQVCLNDLEYGIPIHLRNAMKQMMNENPDSTLPSNEMMKRFVGLSSKGATPLDIEKLQRTIKNRVRVMELPFESDINTAKDSLFLYNIDRSISHSQIISAILPMLKGNLEKDAVTLNVNTKFHIASLKFKRNGLALTGDFLSSLPRLRDGKTEKGLLTVGSCRIHVTSMMDDSLDVKNTILEDGWERKVQNIILHDIKSDSNLKSIHKRCKRTISSKKNKGKSLRNRPKLDL